MEDNHNERMVEGIKGIIEDVPKEKELPHIIEELDVTWRDDILTKIIKDKINEIIQVVNIMMSGGRKL